MSKRSPPSEDCIQTVCDSKPKVEENGRKAAFRPFSSTFGFESQTVWMQSSDGGLRFDIADPQEFVELAADLVGNSIQIIAVDQAGLFIHDGFEFAIIDRKST